MRPKINAEFQAVQFSMVAANMRTIARDQRRTKEEKLEELAAREELMIAMIRMNADHWRELIEQSA